MSQLPRAMFLGATSDLGGNIRVLRCMLQSCLWCLCYHLVWVSRCWTMCRRAGRVLKMWLFFGCIRSVRLFLVGQWSLIFLVAECQVPRFLPTCVGVSGVQLWCAIMFLCIGLHFLERPWCYMLSLGATLMLCLIIPTCVHDQLWGILLLCSCLSPLWLPWWEDEGCRRYHK